MQLFDFISIIYLSNINIGTNLWNVGDNIIEYTTGRQSVLYME